MKSRNPIIALLTVIAVLLTLNLYAHISVDAGAQHRIPTGPKIGGEPMAREIAPPPASGEGAGGAGPSGRYVGIVSHRGTIYVLRDDGVVHDVDVMGRPRR